MTLSAERRKIYPLTVSSTLVEGMRYSHDWAGALGKSFEKTTRTIRIFSWRVFFHGGWIFFLLPLQTWRKIIFFCPIVGRDSAIATTDRSVVVEIFFFPGKMQEGMTSLIQCIHNSATLQAPTISVSQWTKHARNSKFPTIFRFRP